MPYLKHLEVELLLSPEHLQRQSLHATSGPGMAPDVIEDYGCNTWTDLKAERLVSVRKGFLVPENYLTTLLAADYGESHFVSETRLPASHYQYTHTKHLHSDHWSLCLSKNTSRITPERDEAPNDSSTNPDEEQYISLESTLPLPLKQAISQERSIKAHLCYIHEKTLPRLSTHLEMSESDYVVGQIDEKGWNHMREEERSWRREWKKEQDEAVRVMGRRRSI